VTRAVFQKNIFMAVMLCYTSIACAQQQLGFSLADKRTKVVIPIEIQNNLVVVPVIINNALPLKFILDTGVRTAILTQKAFSDILNLQYARKYSIAAPGINKNVDAYITNNVSLDLPGVTGRGHAMLVLGEDYLELRNYLGTEVHGILGYELFSRFIVQIDYEKKQLTLMTPGRFRFRKRFHKLPMTIEDTKPYVKTPVVLADGTVLNAKLLVDSGASHGLMLEPSSDSSIHVPDSTVSSVIGRGLGGEIMGKVGRIGALKLGPYSLDYALANFPDPNSYFDSLKIGMAERNGAIGGEVLSRFKIVFNFPGEEIYFKKNQSFKKKFHYNLSGITVKAKGSRLNVFEITQVRGRSVADQAGIQAGDVILMINGIPTDMLELNHVNGYFNLKPGKRIRLILERNGERIKREFRLQDQI
jgi:hypothetical protein